MPRRPTIRVFSSTTCCGGSTPPARATTTSTCAKSWSDTAPTATRCASSWRDTRAGVPRPARPAPRTSTSSRDSTGSRAPMFMATARIDAIWIHDGLLDRPRLQDGIAVAHRVCDVPAAKVQAFALAPAAQRRGLQLRLRYEYLQPEIDEDPEPWDLDDDELAAVEEELRAAVARMWDLDDWVGVAEADVCGRCQYRSICRDSATPGEPAWPVLSTAEPMVLRRAEPDDEPSRCRASTASLRRSWHPGCLVFPSSSVSARSRSTYRPRPRARRSSSSRTRPARPKPTRARRCSSGPTSSPSCTSVSWPYADPGAFLARRLGIAPKTTAVSTVGGNSPQLLVDEMAERIQRGECDVVLIGGAESMHTRWRARREPRVELVWETGDDAPCAWVIGDDRPGSSDEEMRARRGRADHGVSVVRDGAARGRRSHDRRASTARQRAVVEVLDRRGGQPARVVADRVLTRRDPTVTPDNRMVVFPYVKRMCANIDVDQGARRHPLLVRGGPRGRRRRRPHGVPRTRPPRRTTTGSSPNVSRSHDSPGARGRRDRRARRARRSASTTSLTSTSIRASRPRCEIAQRELGIDDDRVHSPSPVGSASRADP